MRTRFPGEEEGHLPTTRPWYEKGIAMLTHPKEETDDVAYGMVVSLQEREGATTGS